MPVILYCERDADLQMQKQIFIYTDGQHMEILIGSVYEWFYIAQK